MSINKLPFRNILIVGGGGFIGQAFIKRLMLSEGYNIIAVGRSSAPKFLLPASIAYHTGDITDPAFIGPLLDWADTVVDLAYGTTPKTSFDDPVKDVILNLPASVSLQRMSSERQLRQYLLVSSGGTVYGRPNYLPIDESHPNNPISPYGISKLVTEKYAGFFFQMKNLPVVIARPGNAYGIGQFGPNPQGFIGVSMHAILNELPIEIFGERGTVRDYLYIHDLADALIALLNHGVAGETYNIGSETGSDNADVLNAIRKVIGEQYNIKTIIHPLRPFDVSANVLNCKKIKDHTGWSPEYSLLQGIDETWNGILKLNNM